MTSDDDDYSAYVPLSNVAPLDPENWPPQLGDIWESQGVERVVVRPLRYLTEVEIRSIDGGFCITPEELKSLNPRLVRRREVENTS